jgi:hypothetical protein
MYEELLNDSGELNIALQHYDLAAKFKQDASRQPDQGQQLRPSAIHHRWRRLKSRTFTPNSAKRC